MGDMALIIGIMFATSSIFYTWESHYLWGAIATIPVFFLAANYYGLYSRPAEKGLAGEVLLLFQLWTLVIMVVLFIAYVLKISEMYSRAAILVWFTATPISTPTSWKDPFSLLNIKFAW